MPLVEEDISCKHGPVVWHMDQYITGGMCGTDIDEPHFLVANGKGQFVLESARWQDVVVNFLKANFAGPIAS